ncbi:hypothetical protein HGRIS_008523 [Hohenbuehelia grisea]|uniref:Uncharacterized protein n=1 Tax=Hohenbuehelia grisea TaxID=104357 RepID=A0ABR3J8S0_9AGAR
MDRYGHNKLITTYYSRADGSAISEPCEQFKTKRTPVMTFATELVKLSGTGRHLMNDDCTELGVFPGEPIVHWLRDKDKTLHLFETIKARMLSFGDPKILKRISTVVNSDNPFAHNAQSNRNYKSMCCNTFRRTVALIPRRQYNDMLKEGLFDPNHTIGQPYNKPVHSQTGNPDSRVPVRVFFRAAPLNCYTIIRAKAPQKPGWVDGKEMIVKMDISIFSHKTDVGPAEYLENLAGHASPQVLLSQEEASKPGRKKKVYTGKRGRPAKKPTKKQLEVKAKHETLGCRQTMLQNILEREAKESSRSLSETSNTDIPALDDFGLDGEDQQEAFQGSKICKAMTQYVVGNGSNNNDADRNADNYSDANLYDNTGACITHDVGNTPVSGTATSINHRGQSDAAVSHVKAKATTGKRPRDTSATISCMEPVKEPVERPAKKKKSKATSSKPKTKFVMPICPLNLIKVTPRDVYLRAVQRKPARNTTREEDRWRQRRY